MSLPLPRMNHISWPIEKSAVLPRTISQHAYQDFKKEPPDVNAAELIPQSLVALHILQQLNFGRVIGGPVSLWTSHDSGSPTIFHKSLV